MRKSVQGAMLAQRVREVRVEKFGEEGVPALAALLGIPPATWQNYEAGVSMPGTVILQFVGITGANPKWLLSGDGERYAGGGRCGEERLPGWN